MPPETSAPEASGGPSSIPSGASGRRPAPTVGLNELDVLGENEAGLAVVSRIAPSAPAAESVCAWANRAVIALHLILAPLVVLRQYTITQDGPSHLYGAHILWSLRHDPGSPYRRFFASNLRPIGNSLFSYVSVALEGLVSSEHIAGLALLAALWGLPLSAVAFAAALRRATPTTESTALPAVSATALACPLAYNYFLYRGFFNYTLGVPLAVLALSAVIASGAPRTGRLERSACAMTALGSAVLASLAHPSATVFLLAAIPLACMGGGRLRRLLGAAVVALLVAFSLASRLTGNQSASLRFSSPFSSTWMFARAVGITHSLVEVAFAIPLLGLAGWGAFRALREFRRAPRTWTQHWPALLAVALVGAYFFVPFEFGGAAGLNERIPLFVMLLLLPYVPLTVSSVRPLLAGFVLFGVYTLVESVPRNSAAGRVRTAHAAELIPKGSVVYPVALQNKLASLSADLGLHLLADIARQRDLVMPEAFCSHPAHVLRCIASLPGGFDASAVQKFEHLSLAERRGALRDPNSGIRKAFQKIVETTNGAEYLLVLRAATLDDAFEEYVVKPLRITRLGLPDEPIGVYRLPGHGAPEPSSASR